MKANELNLQIMSTIPAIGIAYVGVFLFRKLWWTLYYREKGRGIYQKEQRTKLFFMQLEQSLYELLTLCQHKESARDKRYEFIGRCVYYLNLIQTEVKSMNLKPFTKSLLNDDLYLLKKSFHGEHDLKMKLRIITRINQCYAFTNILLK
jgi:hypothetical protein